MNLPKDYQSKMQEMLGEEYLQYLDSFHYSYGKSTTCSPNTFIMRENRNYPHTRIIMQESIICRSRVRWRRQRFYR